MARIRNLIVGVAKAYAAQGERLATLTAPPVATAQEVAHG